MTRDEVRGPLVTRASSALSDGLLSFNSTGSAVHDLQTALAKLGSMIPDDELEGQRFGPVTQLALRQLQLRQGLGASGVFDEPTARALDEALSRIAAPAPGGGIRVVMSSIGGRVLLDDGSAAGGLTLRLYAWAVGIPPRRVAETKTDAQGLYALSYDGAGRHLNVEVRCVEPRGREISLSRTQLEAAEHEDVDLVAPLSALPRAAEYDRLWADLSREVADPAKLSDVREDDEHPDVSTLAANTGWDARLIAMAVRATQLSSRMAVAADGVYALLRAGLPTEPNDLAHVSSADVESALRRGGNARILDVSDQLVSQFMAAFSTATRQLRRNTTAPGALSSMGMFIDAADLSEAEKVAFESAVDADISQAAGLWGRVAAAGVPAAKITILQQQGKLAQLTFNNLPLTKSLMAATAAPEGLARLVDLDLYESSNWKERLQALAAGASLDELIPPVYPGETVGDRLEAYAQDLARKTRLSFPTRTLARRIEVGDPNKGGIHLGPQHDLVAPSVATALRNAERLKTDDGRDFALGGVSMGAFMRANGEAVLVGVAEARRAGTADTLLKLHRLYQITPTDQSLRVLLGYGFESAQDVAMCSEDTFLEHCGAEFESREVCRQVYRKARLVSSATYSFFSMAASASTQPGLKASSPPPGVRTDIKRELIHRFPTLESLFGSMDFCDCEHCRSVLGPAAYLVDLFRFLDIPAQVWAADLNKWQKEHAGTPYPFRTATERQMRQEEWTAQNHSGDVPTGATPYEVLLRRRPDLPLLLLTCENTNTTLPYIDVVNEVLECFVANGVLNEQCVFDTGDSSVAQLLAEPAHVLRTAYDNTLRGAKYPLGLPFDLALETVRGLLAVVNLPRWRLLDTFRSTDQVFAPNAPIDGASLRAERLGLSPGEYGIFTADNPLAHWFELYGYASEAEALSLLTSAKTLARRLGLSYRELADLIQTAFVNPHFESIRIVHELGVEPRHVFRYMSATGFEPMSAAEKQTFEAQLTSAGQQLPDTSVDVLSWLHSTWDQGSFQQALALADASDSASFELTRLRFWDGRDADPLSFVRIHMFVRLWRKAGHAMNDLDNALVSCVRPHELTGDNLGASLKVALVYLADMRALEDRFTALKGVRTPLISLWSDVGTAGPDPLYRRLFLSGHEVAIDPVFRHPLHLYLTAPHKLVRDHLPELQAGVRLSSDDVVRLLAERGTDLTDATLSIPLVSHLYRHGFLARLLKISIPNLLLLKQVSGIDPFAVMDQAPLGAFKGSAPSETLRFAECVELVRVLGLSFADLAGIFLPSTIEDGSSPNGGQGTRGVALRLVHDLATGLAQIQADHPLITDPSSFTDELIAVKLALLLPASASDTFMQMWQDAVEYEAHQGNVLPNHALDPLSLAAFPAASVTYDEVRQIQRLAWQGVLLEEDRGALKAAVPSPLVAGLVEQIAAQQQTFVEAYLAPVVQITDLGALFYHARGVLDAERAVKELARREVLAARVIPFLRRRLSVQWITQALVTLEAADAPLTEALLSDVRLLSLADKPDKPLLDVLGEVTSTGLTVNYFLSENLSDPLTPTETWRGEGALLIPDQVRSVRIVGRIEVSVPGPYRLFASRTGQATHVTLRVESQVVLDGSVVADEDLSGLVELQPGTLYEIVLEQRGQGGTLDLSVQGENLPRGPVGALRLYPQSVVNGIDRAERLLAKSLMLSGALGFELSELRHLLLHPLDFGGISLSKLAAGAPVDPGVIQSQFQALLRLIRYAKLRDALGAKSGELVAIFAAARQECPVAGGEAGAAAAVFDELCGRFAALLRRERNVVASAASVLGMGATGSVDGSVVKVDASSWTNEIEVQRLWDLLSLSDSTGISPSSLGAWAVAPVDLELAHSVRAGVKARYEDATWLRVAQPVFDALRRKRRDALVAYLLHDLSLDTEGQLFEYFLIDPGNEPVVQTSRVQLAISSVQTFIQRCFLNLEPDVVASVLSAKEWAWKKRYRVWEANRKIFMYPENWAEPELREDKSYQFEALEGALVQGDVTSDLVEDAFYQYLVGLEEVSRLEIVSTFGEEFANPADNVLHVLGRTHAAPAKYFYRRYNQGTWSAWEPVPVQVQGNHVALAVWRGRLHLFWVTAVPESEAKKRSAKNADNLTKDLTDEDPTQLVRHYARLQLHWSDHGQGKWSAPVSGTLSERVSLFRQNFDDEGFRVQVSVEKSGDEDGPFKFHLMRLTKYGWFGPGFRLAGRNAPAELKQPLFSESQPPAIYVDGEDSFEAGPTRLVGSGSLSVRFQERVMTEGKQPSPVTQTILGKDAGDVERGTYEIVLPCNAIEYDARHEIAPLIAPFFYQDRLNTFLVEPRLVENVIQDDAWILGLARSAANTDVGKKITLEIEAQSPKRGPGPVEFVAHGSARYALTRSTDWLTATDATVGFGAVRIGPSGAVGGQAAGRFRTGM